MNLSLSPDQVGIERKKQKPDRFRSVHGSRSMISPIKASGGYSLRDSSAGSSVLSSGDYAIPDIDRNLYI